MPWAQNVESLTGRAAGALATPFTKLALTGIVQIIRGQSYEVVKAKDEQISSVLTNRERETIDWVLDNFGRMSANEISEYSHREKAYRFTKAGELIAYEYAKFFQKLPQPRGH